MALFSQYPSFKMLRIGAAQKHINIMICFDKHSIAFYKLRYYFIINHSQISRYCYGFDAITYSETYRINCVMGCVERINFQIFYYKRFSIIKSFYF